MTESAKTARIEAEARRIARRYAHEGVDAEDRRYLEAYAAGEYMTPSELERVHDAAYRAYARLTDGSATPADNIQAGIAADALACLAEHTGPR